MTRERLDQYLDLKREIFLLEAEIESLSDKAGEIVTDVVSSSAEFPFSKHSVLISGLCVRDLERLEARRQLRSERKGRVYREAMEIDRFIDSIEDSQMRQLLSLKYLTGMSWRQVARRLGGKNTEEGVKKRAIGS